MPRDSFDLHQGTLEVMVPRTLAGGPMHGYGIAQWILGRSDGALDVQYAARHQAPRRLDQKRWVEPQWRVAEENRRARCHRLTDPGRQELLREASALRRYVEAMFQVLNPAAGKAQ